MKTLILTLTLNLMFLTTTQATPNKSLKNIRLTTYNSVVLKGAVTDQSVDQLKKDLLDQVIKRGKGNYKIYLVLESPGGSLSAGENFIRYAKQFKNVETVTIFAASMAHAIVQALPGKRYVVEGGTLMAHRARKSVSGQINDGELESRLRAIKALITSMEKRNANRIGIPLKTYKQKVVNEWWTFDDENVEQNIVDEKITLSCSIELQKKKVTRVMRTFFGNIKVKSSACPLL